MKLVKENLYEFHKGNDPLSALGLGIKEAIISNVRQGIDSFNITKRMNKRQIDDLVDQLMGSIDEDALDDLKYKYLNFEYSAAMDIYLDQTRAEQLFWLVMLLGKKNVKVVTLCSDDDVPDRLRYADLDERYEYLENKRVKPLLDKGFELFNKDDNYDLIEYILIKYPSL